MEIIENKYFLLALTFGVYAVSKYIQKRTNLVLLNPILLSIAAIIIFLEITGIDYSKYKEAGSMIEIWLSPCGARTNNFPIGMEIQKTSNSQSDLEKEEWNWRNQPT